MAGHPIGTQPCKCPHRPETGSEDINGDLLEADFWLASLRFFPFTFRFARQPLEYTSRQPAIGWVYTAFRCFGSEPEPAKMPAQDDLRDDAPAAADLNPAPAVSMDGADIAQSAARMLAKQKVWIRSAGEPIVDLYSQWSKP